MICPKCNTAGVENQVLGKTFYYCRTCKEEIALSEPEPSVWEKPWWDTVDVHHAPGNINYVPPHIPKGSMGPYGPGYYAVQDRPLRLNNISGFNGYPSQWMYQSRRFYVTGTCFQDMVIHYAD